MARMMVCMAMLVAASPSLAAPSRRPATTPTSKPTARAADSRGPALLHTVFGRDDGERCGASVALRRDGFVVGANRAHDGAVSQGAVDVFRERSLPSGPVWSLDTVNGHPDGRYVHDTPSIPAQQLSYLGYASDASVDLAVIGMRGFDTPTDNPPFHFDDGAAVVLERSSGQWRLDQEIILMDANGTFIDPQLESDLQDIGLAGSDLTTSGWQFGHDVAVHGDLMAISAPYARVPEAPGLAPHEEAGLVLLFNRSSGRWRYESLLTRDDTTTGEEPDDFDYFGYSVSIFNDLIAIGAPNTEPAGGENNGHVYLFQRTSPRLWDHVETLHPSNALLWRDCGHFGWSVDISGTSVAVGQPGSNALSTCPPSLPYHGGQGRAWVFESDGSSPLTWTIETMLFVELPSGSHPWGQPGVMPAAGAQYGWSVSISPCHVAVGAPGGDSDLTAEGATYLWTRGLAAAGAWVFETIEEWVVSPIAQPGDQWGHAVSVNDRFLAIGGWRCDEAYVDGGAAEIWEISCDCNDNGQADGIDIALDPSLDCDDNGFIDSCEIVWDPSKDAGGQEGGTAPCVPDGVLDTCQISPPESLYWDPAQGGNGHRFEVLPGQISWVDADTAADQLDATTGMASLATWAEAAFVGAYLGWDITSNGEIWLGGEQAGMAIDPTTGWSWHRGDPWSWARWDDTSTNQPDTAGGAETALIAIAPSDPNQSIWDWDDADPDTTAAGWLVEYDRDCNGDGILDEVNICTTPGLDCDGDWRIDDCMIDEGIVPDCNFNGYPDSCDIAWGSADCNGNGRPDQCDLADGTSDDCNFNFIPDECDIDDGTSEDTNGSGVPDECELLVINEIMVNPADNLNGDPDDIVDFSDQFIEIVNFTDQSVDMSGWRIQKSGLNWYWIPSDTVLDPGCVLLIFTEANPIPVYIPAIVQSAGQANNPLETPSSGSTRTITLRSGDSSIVDDVTYGTEVQASGGSITRCPDLIGTDFVRHNYPVDCDITWWTNDHSPGRQIDGGVFPGACVVDSDGDGILDDVDNCYLFNPDQADCNSNGIGDVCDIQNHVDAGGLHEDLDCDWNWVLDTCEYAGFDCNSNGIPDACEVNDGTANDCNSNGLLDQCELDSGYSPDCNGNGIPDDCDIASGVSEDCNDNGRPDSCDIDDGTSLDANGDGIPDECCSSVCDGVDGLLVIINNLGCVGTPPTCPGDFDCSGLVDTGDVLAYLSQCSFK